MDKNVFTFSKDGNKEYSASIVRIGELIPIEGSDFLAKTVVDGEDIVIRKDEVTPGDIMVYARIETVLDPGFLAANNLYEWSEREKNSNYPEILEMINNGQEEEAHRKVGFFNKHGRVKMIKLRGCPSKGFLFTKESLVKWKPSLKDVNLEDYIDDLPYFDSIDGEVFIKVYVPWTPGCRNNHGGRGCEKKEPKFDILIPGQFSLHYNTVNINKEIHQFSPEDKVSISVKLHGTSICIGNVLIKKPFQMSKVELIFQKIRKKELRGSMAALKGSKRYADKARLTKKIENLKSKIRPGYSVGYGVVYSSRTVIKNQYINRKVTGGYYGTDVWADYYNLLKSVIPQGYELFGEIVGYVSGSQTYIQKGYDYGCKPGENKLMIYRVSIQEGDKKRELDVPEVLAFSKKLVKDNPTLKGKIHHIDLLWNGTLAELYPDLDPHEHWHENVLKRLKEDTEHFGMEQNEPMNIKKMPREGIVIRKDGDPVCEAYKLKCSNFLLMEGKAIDKGEVDIEMTQNYEGN